MTIVINTTFPFPIWRVGNQFRGGTEKLKSVDRVIISNKIERLMEEKRKGFIRSLIKSVETGANGTQDYIVKRGSGKNKIAKTRQ